MNPLDLLKERLKQKPTVQPNQGVRVILALPTEEKPVITEEKKRPLIIADKDDGTRAKDILEKIKQKKLSIVVKKFPEEILFNTYTNLLFVILLSAFLFLANSTYGELFRFSQFIGIHFIYIAYCF